MGLMEAIKKLQLFWDLFWLSFGIKQIIDSLSFLLLHFFFFSRAIETSLLRTRTPVLMLHLTNLCAEQKGSQPN